MADCFIAIQPKRALAGNVVDLLGTWQGFRGGRGSAFGGVPRELRLRLAREFHHVAVTPGKEEAAQLKNGVSAAGGFDLAGDRFQRTWFCEKARAPTREWFDVRTVVEAARVADAVVAEIRASASAFATVWATAAVIAGRAVRTGTTVSGRSTRAGATIILTRPTWTIAPRRTIRAGAARSIWTGPTGAAEPARAGTAVFLPGTTRAIGTGTPRRAAGAVEILTCSKSAAIAARPFIATCTAAPITLTLAAATGFPFMLRRTTPDDLARRGFALLQVPYPIRSQV